MTAAQIKSVALFFYFALLDEEMAEKSARQIIEKARQRLKGMRENESIDSLIVIIHETNQLWLKIQDFRHQAKISTHSKSNFLLPPGTSFGAWRQFHKEASAEDLAAVIWSKVVGAEESKIAQGLGLSEGTVRYRVGKGLRQLGRLIMLGERLA